MFTETINQTLLSNQIADAFFQNKVTGEDYYGDCTLVSTLRALIYKRIQDTDITFSQRMYTVRTADDIKEVFIERNDDLSIFSCPETLLEDIKEQIEENSVVGDFKRIKKITEFFVKSFKVYCYVNDSTHQCILLVSPLTVRVIHYLQCSIIAFLPWYFTNEEGKITISKDEMELVQSLRDKNSTKYVQAIEKIANQFDMRTAYITKELQNVGSFVYRSKLRKTRGEIDSYKSQLVDLQDRVSSIMTKLNDQLVLEIGLRNKINTPDDSIKELFLSRQSLILIPGTSPAETGEIRFAVRGYCDFFDEDIAETCIKNDHSYVYWESDDVTHEGQKRILTELFLEHKYDLRLRFCAEFEINIERNTVRGISRTSYPPECDTYMPNPHIDRYSCIGNNERLMVDCLINGDFAGCVEQCMSSCYGLNFTDSAVMEVFAERFFCNTNKKCIELPNGEVVSIVEALEWIAEKEKENE